MIWAERDFYRWRRRFALLPRKLGTRWIWLERYAWRFVRGAPHHIGPRPFSDAALFTEFIVRRSGYTIWREQVFYAAIFPPLTIWHDAPPRRARAAADGIKLSDVG